MATSFRALKLLPELVAAIRKHGFRVPTPIQSLAIPAVLKGRDVVVEAKTGSGKTLAYALPLLNATPKQVRYPEALVLVPTRELAEQIRAVLAQAGTPLERRVVALTGGGGMDKQSAELAAGAQVVVATMGRLEELLERKLLELRHVRTLVLDEVDELLLGGGSANLAALLKLLPTQRQTLLFSATVPAEVEKVARQFMRDPQRIRLTPGRDLPAEISHRVLRTAVGTRDADLVEYLQAERPYQALLFCGTRHEAEEVQEALETNGIDAEFLHGDLSAVKRRKLIERFRDGDLPVLVASDLVARGLDLPGVDLVVNYSLPQGMLAYVHRAGRTGRAGKAGSVVSLLIPQQNSRFVHLQETFTFEIVEVHGAHVHYRPVKTRQERDLQYRKLPRFQPRLLQAKESPAPPERGRPRGRSAR